MADGTFEVALTDGTSARAKAAAAALRAVKAAADEAARAADKASESLGKIKTPASPLAPVTSQGGPLAAVPETVAPRRRKKNEDQNGPLAPLGDNPDSAVAPLRPKKKKGAGADAAATEDAFAPVFKGMTAPKNAGRLVQGVFGVINKVGSFGNAIQSKFGDEIGGFALQAMGEKAKEGVKNLVFKTAGGLLSGIGSLVTVPFTIAASATQMLGTALIAGIGAAAAFSVAVGGLTVELVKMSLEAQVAQDALDAMSIGLDSSAISKSARDISDVIGATADKAQRAMQKMSRLGFSNQLSKDIAQAVADLDLVNGAGSGDALAKGINDLATKQAGGYESIKQALGKEGGDQLTQNLAQILKLNGKGKPAELKAQIEAAITAGKLTKDEATRAALNAVSKTTKLDVGGAQQWFTDNTLAGNLQGLSVAWTSLMGDIGSSGNTISFLRDLRKALDGTTDSGKAIRAALKPITQLFDEIVGKVDIKSIIGDITKAFDPATASGARFQSIIGKISMIFDKLMGTGKKGGFTLTDGLEIGLVVLEKMVDAAMTAADVFAAVSPVIRGFFEAIGGGDTAAAAGGAIIGAILGMIPGVGSLVSQLSALWDVATAVTALFEDFSSAFDGAGDWLSGVGPQMVDGLWNGLTSAWSSMIGQFDGLVALLPASVKSILGIASPSKVFAQLGVHTMAGFEVGIDRGAGGVQDAVQAGINPDVAPPRFGGDAGAPGAGAAVARSSSVGDITIEIHSSSADPKQVANEALSALIDKLEALGLEMGARLFYGRSELDCRP